MSEGPNATEQTESNAQQNVNGDATTEAHNEAPFPDANQEGDRLLVLARILVDQIGKQKTQAEEDASVIASAKGEAASTRTQIDATKKSIKSRSEKLEGLFATTESKLSSIQEKQKAVDEKVALIDKGLETANKGFADVQNIVEKVAAHEKDVQAKLEKLNEAQSHILALETEIKQLSDKITATVKSGEETAAKVYDALAKAKQKYSETFEDDRDGNGEITRKSVSTELRDLCTDFTNEKAGLIAKGQSAKSEWDEIKTNITQSFDEAQKEFLGKANDTLIDLGAKEENLRKALEKDIRALLPDAGAAGLAYAYVDAKARYSFVPYSPSSKTVHPFLGLIGHLLQGAVPSLFFYVMFLAPLIYIIYFFSPIMADLQEGKHIDSALLVFKTILSVPLGAISLFGWASIRLNRLLYEEYNHKQRVMQLYRSFKDEIEASSENEETKRALLAIMLKAVNEKPSLKMHKYDKPIEINFPDLDPIKWIKKAIPGSSEGG